MTLRQFFLEYLWPLDTCSLSRSTDTMQGIHLSKNASQEGIDKVNADHETLGRPVPTKGIRLHLQIQLRSNLQTYVRRWFMVSVGLFALAWASSLVLTMLGALAALAGLGLLGVRHYVDNKDTADKASDAYGTFRTSTNDESAEIHRNNLH